MDSIKDMMGRKLFHAKQWRWQARISADHVVFSGDWEAAEEDGSSESGSFASGTSRR